MTLLAIDIGSSGPKASIYASSGEVLCSARNEYQLCKNARQRHGYELDSEQLWASLVAVLSELPQSRRMDVAAISLSSHGESFVPVDAEGIPLGPFILNLDLRAVQEAEEFAKWFGHDELYRLTGLPTHAMYPLPKIAWLRRHRAEIFDKAAKFLCVEDYLLSRVGVGSYISESLASRTFGFEIETGEWSKRLLAGIGLSPERFACPVPSGKALGVASTAAAAELGLPAKAIWVSGGHDQACCSLGGGGMLQSVAVDGTGTFECVTIAHRDRVVSPFAFHGNFPTERHVIPQMFVTLAYTPAGIVPDWLRQVTGDRALSQRQSYASLFSNLPSGPTGLLFFPHLVGTGTPWFDAEARGAILGLSATTTKEDLYKGALEGITYEMLWNLETLKQAGLQFERIHAVGGGARSTAWMQLKADIFGCEVVEIAGEASCMGAAICAGVGIGAFSSWQEGASALIHEQRAFYPDIDRRNQYREFFENYKLFAEKIYGYHLAASQMEAVL